MARRPRSASLKALPPDSAPGVEVQSISTGAVHWSVNSKEKPAFGRQRPLKSVSLKLAKGDGSPTASRSNSPGAAWGSGELLIDARQCIPKAGSGPPSRGSATEADQKAPEKCVRDGRNRQSQTLPSRCKATGETSSTVGRPPVPKSLHEVSAQEPSTSSYPSRSDVPVLDEETSSRPSSSSYQRAAAIYASLPKTPGGTRTLVRDADGFIFRPSVEAEVKATPPQPRLRPGSRGLNELVASLTKRRAVPEKREAADPVEDPVHPVRQVPGQSTSDVGQSTRSPPEIPPPRIAWSEGSLEDGVDGVDGVETTASADTSDLAAQIRRDWLAKQLSELDELEGKNGPSADSKEDSTKTPLRTEDGRRSMGELEKSLAKAKERAEKNRKELKGYMEGVRNKIFQADDGNLSARNEELLVSLPADFDDVVDINASLTTAERRRSRHRNSISSGGGHNSKAGGTSSSAAELAEGFRLPTFLEKYFYEEKAVELPIVQMQQEESELDKVTRQVAKLDLLLSRREADGVARLQVAKEELEATKEHLRRESEQSEAEKIELLKKLKERGLLRCQSSTSKAASAASSSANSPRHSASVSCFSPSQSSEVDWSGWECSVEAEAASAPKSAPLVAKPSEMDTSKEEESDTSTFNLTATTADLNNLGQGLRKSSKRSKLAPVVEDTVHEGKPEEQETAEGEELAAMPLPLPEELLQDPYDLEALHAIDDKLAQIVPESEWEAKSIRSTANGSEVSAGVQSKTSKHSVLSHLATSSLPGEPVLREQLEEREARKALIAIDDQLGRLQEQRQSELQPEQLQQLLLEAAASESAMDSSSKVLTLTAADDLEASLQRMLLPFRINADPVETSDGPLVEAKKILSRLSQSNEEWDSTNLEARYSMVELEDSVRAMEERASRPNTAQKDEQNDELIVEMSSWARKLEELSQEALMVAEQGLPLQVQAEGGTGGATASGVDHDVSPEEKNEEADQAEMDLDEGFASEIGPLMLPSLKGAEAPMQEADLDLSLDSDDLESESSGNSPVFLPVAEVQVTKAVELDLPEGEWSDEDLERLSKAMEEHFGPRAKPGES